MVVSKNFIESLSAANDITFIFNEEMVLIKTETNLFFLPDPTNFYGKESFTIEKNWTDSNLRVLLRAIRVGDYLDFRYRQTCTGDLELICLFSDKSGETIADSFIIVTK